MSSGKKRTQDQAINRGNQGQALEDQRAQEMKDNLSSRHNAAIGEVAEVAPQVKAANTRQLETGGVSAPARERVQRSIDNTGDISNRLVSSANYSAPTSTDRGKGVTEASYGRGREGYNEIAMGGITGASYGRGRETYDDLSKTGGFSQAGRDKFIRSSTAPISSIYARAKDESNRHAAIGGFNSDDARVMRQAANAGGEASTRANVELENQVRAGKLAGAQGLERTRTASGEEYLAGLSGLERTREASGREYQTGLDSDVAGRNSNTAALSAGANASNNAARNNLDLELGTAKNTQDAINSTQKYLESVQGELTESDRMQISNRLAQLGMTKADIDALIGVAGQKQSTMQNIQQGLAIGGQVAGGIAGAIP